MAPPVHKTIIFLNKDFSKIIRIDKIVLNKVYSMIIKIQQNVIIIQQNKNIINNSSYEKEYPEQFNAFYNEISDYELICEIENKIINRFDLLNILKKNATIYQI